MVELIVAVTVVSVLGLILANFYVDRLHDYSRASVQTILQSNTQLALNNLTRDVRSATAIVDSNQWADLNGPGGNPYGWSSTSGSPSVIVLEVPAKDTNGNLAYVDLMHSAVETDDVVYFVSGNILYRRTIANPLDKPHHILAGITNSTKTTCPQATSSPSCPADGKVIEDVANLLVDYFDTNNDPATVPSDAQSIAATLSQSRSSFGRTYSNSFTSRATLRNKP